MFFFFFGKLEIYRINKRGASNNPCFNLLEFNVAPLMRDELIILALYILLGRKMASTRHLNTLEKINWKISFLFPFFSDSTLSTSFD